jgi:hypothetical protein
MRFGKPSWQPAEENARAVCRISIYVTDQDPARQALQNEIHYTALSQNVRFWPSHFGRIIEDHSFPFASAMSVFAAGLLRIASMAQDLHHCKISNDSADCYYRQ